MSIIYSFVINRKNVIIQWYRKCGTNGFSIFKRIHSSQSITDDNHGLHFCPRKNRKYSTNISKSMYLVGIHPWKNLFFFEHVSTKRKKEQSQKRFFTIVIFARMSYSATVRFHDLRKFTRSIFKQKKVKNSIVIIIVITSGTTTNTMIDGDIMFSKRKMTMTSVTSILN